MAKKAWEYERKWIQEAIPPEVDESSDNEKEWMVYLDNANASDCQLFTDWYSEVPGSKAPCHLIVAAIECMREKGYLVAEAEKWIEPGLKAVQEKNGSDIQVITAKIYRALQEAEKNENSPYWNHRIYRSFLDVKKDVSFVEPIYFDVHSKQFQEKVYAGWMGQLIGGCLGTQIEGYTTDNIRKRFGEVRGYLRKPETYNDDITYELAYLDGFSEKGYNITSLDVADKWLEFIADGYSAEKVALENLRHGLVPPMSGQINNYFSDWIGAQMRTPMHGMLAPGNPELAARLAVDDSVVSHSNSGMLGGMFNAMLVSLSFVEKSMKSVLQKTVDMIPHESEYYTVVKYAFELCKTEKEWEEAWKKVEEKYKEYNWIHAYPNVAAEIIALWYGNDEFEKTCHIIAMEGQDADCTAAPVLNALLCMIGLETVGEHWIKPIGKNIATLMRRMRNLTIDELCEKTVNAVRKATA